MKRKQCQLKLWLWLALLFFLPESSWCQSTGELIQELHQRSSHDSAYVNLLNIIADSVLNMDEFDSCMVYLNLSVEAAEEVHYAKGEARAKYLLGRTFIAQSKDAEGMKWITEARKLYDSIHYKPGIADCIMQSGLVSYGQKDYPKALAYFNDAYANYNDLKFEESSAKSLYLAGLCLTELDSFALAEQKLLASEKLNIGLNNILRVNECYWGLGELYLKMKQYPKAQHYFEKIESYFLTSNNDQGVARARLGLGMVALETGEREVALKNLTDAFEKSKAIKYYPVLLRSSYGLYNFFLADKNYPKALEFQTEYFAARDSVFTLDNANKIAALQYKSELDKKQTEIDFRTRQRHKELTIRYLLLGSVLWLVILVIMAFQRYRFKQKTNLTLEKANRDLGSAMNDLKAAQNQMVLTEKMASLGQLTAGIAHEINNPINFVSASISPLKRNFADVKKLIDSYEHLLSETDYKAASEKLKKEYDAHENLTESENLLDGIEEGSRRTTEIVKGLRNFSRLDSEQMKKVNINEGIDSTLPLVQNKLTQLDIEVTRSFGDIPHVQGYPGQLNQVFMNILTNAIDATAAHGKIFISTSREKNFVKISFRDTGIGISPEVKKKIFDPFFTTKEVGKGTGLGLSISYGIIEKHNGRIEVVSEEGKGAEFIILLPVQP